VFSTFLAVMLADGLAESMIESNVTDAPFKDPGIGQGGPFTQGGGVVLKRIEIKPEGMLVTSLIPRVLKANRFNPSVQIDVTITTPPSATSPDGSGVYHFPGNEKAGCPAANFTYTEHWTDTSISLKLVASDVALPTSASPWTVEIGHAIGYDPRPLWSG